MIASDSNLQSMYFDTFSPCMLYSFYCNISAYRSYYPVTRCACAPRRHSAALEQLTLGFGDRYSLLEPQAGDFCVRLPFPPTFEPGIPLARLPPTLVISCARITQVNAAGSICLLAKALFSRRVQTDRQTSLGSTVVVLLVIAR